jgi:SAM-dependent methyltransferase
MKLNIGSGDKRFEGFINIDDDPHVNPDYIINLDDVNLVLPFDDNSVEEIKAIHVLEHIGDGFIRLMQELYRVSKDGCIIDIVAPNEYHAVFYGDPTHKRPINVNVFHTLSKSKDGYLARKYEVNFVVADHSFNYDSMYIPMIQDFYQRKEEGKTTQQEDFAFMRLMREANNVAIENVIKLEVVKYEKDTNLWSAWNNYHK